MATPEVSPKEETINDVHVQTDAARHCACNTYRFDNRVRVLSSHQIPITMKNILVVIALLAAFFGGTAIGMYQKAHDQGIERGRAEALATVNDLLKQRGYTFWFRYTDSVYEYVIPQGSLKAHVGGKNRITPTERRRTEDVGETVRKEGHNE